MTHPLPPLPFWQARSFYAQILLAAAVLLNARGIDLMAVLADLGLGGSPDEVVSHGVGLWQALAPIAFGLWAWAERRAPRFRLSLGGGPAAAVLAVALAAALPGPAEAASCLPQDQALAQLTERYGETMEGGGVSGPDGPAVALFVNRETGTWTMIVLVRGMACLLGAGTGWRAAEAGPPGEAM